MSTGCAIFARLDASLPTAAHAGVRERWARNKATLRHGVVEWDLRFTFCVDMPADGAVEGSRLGVPPRLLADRALEVRCPVL